MSLQSERIQLLMQRLSLTEMVHGYEALAEQAAQKNLPYCDFLEQVLESEANVRQERNIKVRTQLAGFPDLKRLEQFDFKFPTSIDEKKIRELAAKVKAFVVPELNLGQMVREVERAAAGQAKTFAVSHAGGGVHNPEDILNAIVEAAR